MTETVYLIYNQRSKSDVSIENERIYREDSDIQARLSTGPQQVHQATHNLLSLQRQGSSLLLHTCTMQNLKICKIRSLWKVGSFKMSVKKFRDVRKASVGRVVENRDHCKAINYAQLLMPSAPVGSYQRVTDSNGPNKFKRNVEQAE